MFRAKKVFIIIPAISVLILFGWILFRIEDEKIPIDFSGNLSIEEARGEGLNIQEMSVAEGVGGWYEKDGARVYFRAKRGNENPWDERHLFSAPKYEIAISFSDNSGKVFYGRGEYQNLPPMERVAEGGGEKRLQSSGKSLALQKEALELLKKVRFSQEMFYEYEALSDIEISD
jgi:hypothetical protein